jgi:hypothetical protein
MISFKRLINKSIPHDKLFSNIRTFSLLIALAVTAFNSFAQKLPTKQEGSVRAPAVVKIDGKANE